MKAAAVHALIIAFFTATAASAADTPSGPPPAPKEHLAQLDRLCFFGCEEYSKLKKAIAEHEQQQAKK